jgi:hypothetical protein
MIDEKQTMVYWDKNKDKKLQAYERIKDNLLNEETLKCLKYVKDVEIDYQIERVDYFI